jgi:hypothetical protein
LACNQINNFTWTGLSAQRARDNKVDFTGKLLGNR